MGLISMRAWACGAALSLAAVPAVTQATIVTLTDRNSSASFNLDNDLGSAGQQTWFVDGGVDQIKQQWFWYRVGPTGGESRIDTISPSLSIPSNGDFDPGNESLAVQYQNAQLRVTITYELTGGLPGSGVADLGELIAIDNLSGAPLDLHFFQYVDFDLNGTAGNDSGQLTGAPVNTASQSDPNATATEEVTTPAPSQYQIGSAATLSAALNDGSPTNAGTIAGPVGPGDVAWLFQWDQVIPANGSLLISKDKGLVVVVPEPATASLLALGATGLLLRRRRGA